MASLYENFRQLITLVDELRDLGLQGQVSLPRIAAIGSQSSGKSSLIESIVGLNFLPRGSGVVTRRPLELRLTRLKAQGDQAWAVFDDAPDKKFTDFAEVRAEIQRQTDSAAGTNKGIIADPIVLTIHATGAPDLTLIDLPGITRVPVHGSDQTEDIESITREMTLRYITDPRTIILAVLPANQDMSVSDALQLAKCVDPNGSRSIGVITKIDLMDQGVDACSMLKGEDVPLGFGYVGVKMRSQYDIENQKSVKQSLEDEKEWFASHKVYKNLPQTLIGTSSLVQKLTQLLFSHIRKHLPEMKREINEKRRLVKDRLEAIGSGVPTQQSERHQLVWKLATDYCDLFSHLIHGKYHRKLHRYISDMCNSSSNGAAPTMPQGAARVRAILTGFLSERVDICITDDLPDEDISRAICMHGGDGLTGYPSPDVFEFLALPYLRKLSEPGVQCVHNVAEALDEQAKHAAAAVFVRFPEFGEEVLGRTRRVIEKQRETTRTIVEQLVETYSGYLFTNDRDYVGYGPAPFDQPSRAQPIPEVAPFSSEYRSLAFAPETEDSPTKVSTGIPRGRALPSSLSNSSISTSCDNPSTAADIRADIRRRIDSYFAVALRNIRDTVPRTIGHYLVRQVQDKLQYDILNHLNAPEQFPNLLGEPSHIVEERRSLMAQDEILQRSLGVLLRDPTLAAATLEGELEATRAAESKRRAASYSESDGASGEAKSAALAMRLWGVSTLFGPQQGEVGSLVRSMTR